MATSRAAPTIPSTTRNVVIASEAKQSRIVSAEIVWIASSLSLLAMTMGRDNGQTNRRRRHRIRPMPVRQGRLRDRRARALGLARPFRIEPPRAWRGLRHLCRQLAQTLSYRQGQDADHALRGQGDRHRAQFLCDLRHAIVLRTRPLAAHGQHPARACSPAAPDGSRSITSRSKNCRNGPIPASRWCR